MPIENQKVQLIVTIDYHKKQDVSRDTNIRDSRVPERIEAVLEIARQEGLLNTHQFLANWLEVGIVDD